MRGAQENREVCCPSGRQHRLNVGAWSPASLGDAVPRAAFHDLRFTKHEATNTKGKNAVRFPCNVVPRGRGRAGTMAQDARQVKSGSGGRLRATGERIGKPSATRRNNRYSQHRGSTAATHPNTPLPNTPSTEFGKVVLRRVVARRATCYSGRTRFQLSLVRCTCLRLGIVR